MLENPKTFADAFGARDLRFWCKGEPKSTLSLRVRLEHYVQKVGEGSNMLCLTAGVVFAVALSVARMRNWRSTVDTHGESQEVFLEGAGNQSKSRWESSVCIRKGKSIN